MTAGSAPRFSTWFHRWWIAVVGAVVAAGGVVLYAVQHALASTSFGWFAYQPLAATAWAPTPNRPLAILAGVLIVVGLIAVAGTVGYRLGRRR